MFTLHRAPQCIQLFPLRVVNFLGRNILGLSCRVHFPVLLLLLVHPIVSDTWTCLEPSKALSVGGCPSTTEGSGQVHSQVTVERNLGSQRTSHLSKGPWLMSLDRRKLTLKYGHLG